ncbi:MAG TPA: hypothetical protein VJ046_02020 [Candidatus Paceibacterota bacterium]|nr:hypothetical protein [Candidatus Paceibacterota bacterium]
MPPEVKKIISIIKTLTLPNGALALERSRGNLKPFNIFSDLGDFLPFLLYFGEEEFIEKQIELLKEELGPDKILISQFPTMGMSGLAKTYEYTDLLLGLTDWHLFKKDDDSRELLLDVADKAIDMFCLDGTPRSFYRYFKIPVTDTRDGTLIECFVDIARATGENKYADIANNIYRRLFNNTHYEKYGLLPAFFTYKPLTFFLGGEFKKTAVFKNNTNTIFALQALYRFNGDNEIKERIFKMISKLYFSDYKESLTPSFGVLDLLCDNHMLFKRDQDLSFAKEIASYWLKFQGKTGLLPLYPSGKESFIDSETDMSIALKKLYEITSDNKYKTASDLIFDGFVKHHGKFDYPLSVNVDTGELVNDTQRTKFLALALKLFLEGDAYENWGILRDR